jgi:hypothetical protein
MVMPDSRGQYKRKLCVSVSPWPGISGRCGAARC